MMIRRTTYIKNNDITARRVLLFFGYLWVACMIVTVISGIKDAEKSDSKNSESFDNNTKLSSSRSMLTRNTTFDVLYAIRVEKKMMNI